MSDIPWEISGVQKIFMFPFGARVTPRVTTAKDVSLLTPGLRSYRRLTGVTNASAPLGLLMAQGRYALTLLWKELFSQWMGQCPKGAHA